MVNKGSDPVRVAISLGSNLGDRRANAAKNYLQSRGIDAGRMTVISWGKERPSAVGSDEASWAQNRRAVTVVPE